MPQPSRSRGHGRDYDYDRDRDRDRDRQTRRSERQPLRHDDDDDVFDDDEEEDDEEDDDRPHRSSRAHLPPHTLQPQRRRRESRTRHGRYDGYEGVEEEEEEEEEDDDEDEEEERDPLVVDSRPRFSRPPAPRSNQVPPPVDSRRRRDSQQGRARERAKESPATSPIKKRDREGGRRRRESTGGEDSHSPTKGGGRVRDRRHGDGDRERKKRRDKERDREQEQVREKKHNSTDSANSTAQLLSVDSLAKLNQKNQKAAVKEREREREAKVDKVKKEKEMERSRRKDRIFAPKVRGGGRGDDGEMDEKAWKARGGGKRMVSGAILEEGRGARRRSGKREERWNRGGGGDDDDDGDEESKAAAKKKKKKKKWFWIGIGVLASLLAILIPVAVVIAKKGGDGDENGQSSPSTSNAPSNKELKDIDRDSIPSDAKGTVLDPFDWYDTTDFNVTYTGETVGGLSIMGLKSEWDDSAQANEHVPPLEDKFPYGDKPIRGVNLGGWLSIEPFITPSFFDDYSSGDVVDEYTLTSRLGSQATQLIEKHYATFITEQDFKEIKDAGMDHVRIPFSYWAVKTYDGDPYVPKISWRYLLRAIEYCRKYGLRVNLDVHGLPGSQNGWNHSGRQGSIGWLHGSDGDLHAKRAMEMHDQLSKFFAQPRYENVIAIYGLCNEPKMIDIPIRPVLEWNTEAVKMIRKNGMDQLISFGDGFLLLSKWKTMLQDVDDKMLLDTHQYTIFNNAQIGLSHERKLDLVCSDWVPMLRDSSSGKKGWGPTICGEWSQADTDCTKYLNNVNSGNRWTGTMDSFSSEPNCPTAPNCNCDTANADPSTYSDEYKLFLKTFAEAQMAAFEEAWGWFYWTWKTESAVQWSWKSGRAAGILPEKAYEPAFDCKGEVPDMEGLPDDY